MSEGGTLSDMECLSFQAALTVNVEHHLPLRRSNTLMEPKPHLPPVAQEIGLALGRGEERASDRSVPAARKSETYRHRECISNNSGNGESSPRPRRAGNETRNETIVRYM